MQHRWAQLAAITAALLLLTACGRVNLEDLTPEAVKTQQAEAVITATAAAAEQEELGDEFTGNPQRGRVQYDVWCTGCHDGGRAEPIVGEAFPFSEYEEFFRTGGDIDHPNYNPVTGLSDQNLIDILTYIATAN
ncbi:MAG: cytochrome c [Chloroflexia bacterium]|jgi:mono/diheme cytochrome c family protein|nr:cytochrome c [Chloroflexia bacterium]